MYLTQPQHTVLTVHQYYVTVIGVPLSDYSGLLMFLNFLLYNKCGISLSMINSHVMFVHDIQLSVPEGPTVGFNAASMHMLLYSQTRTKVLFMSSHLG